MNHVKILGIGSPFGDDQAGWKVAERLKQHLVQYTALSSFILIECHDRPGVRLIELIRGFNTVFIIDAIKSGREIGTLHRFQKEDLCESENKLSTHDTRVLHALQIAGALNELPENIQFYGIEVDKISVESLVSPTIENAIKKLALQLEHEIVETVWTSK